MPKVIRPPFKPHSLRKLREISGATVEEAAKRVGKDVETIDRWESDEFPEIPTLSQGEKLGQFYGYPIILALGEIPPHLQPPELPDFRTIENGGALTEEFSHNLRRLILDVLSRQEFVVDYSYIWELSPQEWVGSANPATTEPELLGQMMRDQLKIGVDEQAAFRSGSRAMKAWTRAAGDQAGVFVCQSGRQHGRRIEIDEMRGLSLAHEIAPFAVVNTSASEVGRVFALFHELAHLWVGKEGVSGSAGLDATAQQDGVSVEAYCDASAASALMPQPDFHAAWKDINGVSTTERLNALSYRFGVNRGAVALRAARADLMSWEEYREFRLAPNAFGETSRAGIRSGGNFFATHLRCIGEKYARLVVGAWIDQQIELKEAAHYLEVTPATAVDLANFLGAKF